MFVNLIISKFSTKYQYSSTTVNMIGHVQKIGKTHMHRPGFTHGTLKTTPSTSVSHDNSNETMMQQVKNQ